METIIQATNGLTVLAFAAFLVLAALMKREGTDERAQYMGYKLFRCLFVLLFGGMALLILATSWSDWDYVSLRVGMTGLMSLAVLAGLGYWIYLSRRA